MKLPLLMILSILAYSETIIIKNNLSLKPVKNAQIKIGDSTYFTNKFGRAEINNISNVVKIHAIGYDNLDIAFDDLSKQKFQVYLNETGVEIDEIVVSATRWKQERKNVPIKISSIKKSEVEFKNPQTAADLLEISGEVFVQKSQMGGGSPIIRGFATNRVLLAVDGVRMNNAIFRAGNVQNVISIDPFAIENTEVIFGPGSVIYGSDAIGGVMIFYTTSPKLSQDDNLKITGDAELRTAAANFEKTGHFDINFGSKKWAFIGGISYTDFDDLRMGSNGPSEYLRTEYVNSSDEIIQNDNPEIQKFTGYSQINYLGKVLFEPNSDYRFDATAIYTETSDFPRYDRLIQYSGEQLRSAEWYYGPQKWLFTKLNYRYTGESFFHDALNVFVSYQNFEESRNDRRLGDNRLRTRTETVDAISLNADAEVEIGNDGELFYGAEYVVNMISSVGSRRNLESNEVEDIAARYPDGSRWQSIAGYLNYRHELTDKLNLTAGGRYSYISSKSEFDSSFFEFENNKVNLDNSAFNGSVGLAYRPNNKTHFSTNISSGFRAPNIDDIGKIFESGNGQVVVPNSNLTPEKAFSFEFDVARKFGDYIKVDVAAFYTILNDVMVNRPFTLNGQDSIIFDEQLQEVRAIQNASSGYVYGVQADAEIKLQKNFSITSKISYQKGFADNDDGRDEPLRHVAPMFGMSSISYNKNSLNLSLTAEYNGEISYNNLNFGERQKDHIYAIDPNGNPFSPSWFTLNLYSSYRFNDSFYLTLAVENLLDERYRPYSSGIIAPGINLISAIKVSF